MSSQEDNTQRKTEKSWKNLRQLLSVIAEIAGLLVAVAGLIQVCQGNTSAAILSAIAVGTVLVLAASMYIAFFAKIPGPAVLKGKPKPVPAYPHLRKIAIALLVGMPLLIISVLGWWKYNQSRPINEIVILVAVFSEDASPDPPEDRTVTRIVIEELQKIRKKDPRVVIKPLPEVILDDEKAEQRMISERATIIIYGWYTIRKKTVLYSGFEVSPEKLPNYIPIEVMGKKKMGNTLVL